ncbi:hypothetical protein [Ktedonobacter sp. SOSP1-52]|nr:hypothetical protein [Ktedonobacter sp. SOSP1-52]
MRLPDYGQSPEQHGSGRLANLYGYVARLMRIIGKLSCPLHRYSSA